ncbi:MAG: PQQ-binding-like beta-propeller repeat protein [Acidobacteriota bacterium]|nr:PQQ-binding-like beta-propeller repeat protein [Acidobacteriota bacterium]
MRRLFVVAMLAVVAIAAPATAQVPPLSPVTDALLADPPPESWLNWRRTQNGWGHSALEQITRDNVGELRMAWSWAMETGSQQTTPIVHEGVMFLASPGNIVQALDAATGDLLWEYRREFPTARGRGRPNRNMAIYENTIILNTADANVVALDVATGHVVWEAEVADSEKGYFYTGGSLVADGKVISGMAGCMRFWDDGCFITAHDASTGDELWRTSTVARPGEPGGDSWGDLPMMFRGGGDAWITGTYDAERGLTFWGVAQAKPWAQVSRRTDGDALYTSSTIALDPDTGEMQWYYQHHPGESHDMDEVFERVLVDVDGRPSVFTMGKLGILWQLDRETGQYINATDLGYQNIVDIDPVSGRMSFRPGMVPELDVELSFCPSHSGIKSWRAMSYTPETEAFYIPLTLNCQRSVYSDVEWREGGGGAGMIGRENYLHPDSDGNLGEFVAMHVSGEILWSHRQRTPYISASLTTAGGLVFVGTFDRRAYAYDVQTGETLWQTRLPTSVQGFPITYAVNGTQYVAIGTGIGGGSWTSIPLELTPEKRRPNGGNGLFVFALPEESQ